MGLSNQSQKVGKEKGNIISNLRPTFEPTQDNKNIFENTYEEEYNYSSTVNNHTKPQKFLHSDTEISTKPERKLTEKDKEKNDEVLLLK